MANVQLSSVNSTLLPPIITAPIFQKAREQSAVQQLARQVPLSVQSNTAIPIMMDQPTADWVAEGGVKAVGSSGVGIKQMTGKKVAVLVPVSEEVVMTNAAGLYDQLVQDLPSAISRAFDYAAIHGKSLKTGSAGPFGDYLGATPNSVALGTAAANAGGMYTDLWNGVSKVVNANTAGYDVTGFAADPRLKPELATSVDNNGRPFFVDNSFQANNAANVGNLIGLPAYFNTGVSGRYYRQGDLVQVATINGTPTGGTFTVSVGGQTTSALAYNATAATVQTALRALSVPQAAAITVSGSAGGPYTITFTDTAGPVSVNQTALTGGTAATAQATVAQSPLLDSGLRAIGGDWSQAAWGQGMDITIRVSNEASYYDGSTWHSAFQENLKLLLVEAYYGFVCGDLSAFVAYTHATGS